MPAGNTADISFAVQTTKGTAATTPLIRAYLASGGVAPERTVNDVEETSSGRLRNSTFVSQARSAGTPAFWVRPQVIAPLLWAALGTKVTTGAGDPWTHTFTLAATQPYCTLWRTLATLYERFIDCKISSINIGSGAGGLLRAEVGIVGGANAFLTAANATATPDPAVPWTHMDGKGQFLVEGVAISAISAARVNIGLGVDTAQGDALTPDSVNEAMQDITIETEQIVQDFTLWNRWHYGSATPTNLAPPTPTVLELTGASAIDFKWATRDAAGAVAAPERSLQLVATRVQVTNIAGIEANAGGDPLARTVTYRVVQPAGATSGLTAIVKNGVTAYAAS